MAHIPVHDIRERAALRLGRSYQVAALAPFPARHDGSHWQLNREPYHHLLPPWGMPQELELPEGEEAPGVPGAPRPPAGPGAPRPAGGTAAGETCEQRSYLLRIHSPAGAANLLLAASSPPLPAPCVIVGANAYGNPDQAGPPARKRWWGLCLTSNDLSGPVGAFTGDPLQDTIDTIGAGALEDAGWTIHAPFDWIRLDADISQRDYAQQFVGKVILQEGMRLTFFTHNTTADEVASNILITVRSIVCAREIVPRVTASRASIVRAPAVRAPQPAPPPTNARAYIGKLTYSSTITRDELAAQQARTVYSGKTAGPTAARQTVMYGSTAVQVVTPPPVTPPRRGARVPPPPGVIITGAEAVPFTY